ARVERAQHLYRVVERVQGGFDGLQASLAVFAAPPLAAHLVSQGLRCAARLLGKQPRYLVACQAILGHETDLTLSRGSATTKSGLHRLAEAVARRTRGRNGGE